MRSDLFTYLRAGKRHICLAILAFMLAAFMMPAISLAAESTMENLPTLTEIQEAAGVTGNTAGNVGESPDTSRVILLRLFGEFGESPFTSTGLADTLLGKLFFTFNAVIFVVGTSYIGYQILMAIASSAHEGEVLGKRMNSLWAPIRLGVGVFGMLPVFKGFSLAQSVILGTAILGIGMANMMVDRTVQAASEFNNLIPAPGLAHVSGANGSVDEFIAHNLFAMNVCVTGSGRYANAYGELPFGFNWTAPQIKNTTKGVITSGLFVSCGDILVNDQSKNMRSIDSSIFEKAFRFVGLGGFRTPAVNYEAINVLSKGVAKERRNTLHALQNDVKKMADKWFKDMDEGTPTEYPNAEIIEAVTTALAKEDEAIRKLQRETNVDGAFSKGITDRIKEGGWLSLGSWYATFAEQDAAIQSAFVSNHMEVIPPKLDETRLPPEIQDPLLRAIVSRSVAMDRDSESCGFPGAKRNEVGECNVGQGMAMAILGFLNDGGTGMVNPITTAKNIGDYMLTLVGAFAIADMATQKSGAGGKVQATKGKLAAAALDKFTLGASGYFMGMIGKVSGALLMACFIMGLIFAVYIPLIPFITWFTAAVSYFSSVIEGLVGAQVWAFTHLSSEGEGMGQRTEKGYIYILNMLLRPGLMVLGFFFAAALMTLMATFLFQQLGTAIANMQGDTNTGPFIIVGIIFVYMILLLTLIQTVCNLIYEIPDRVISWFGHSMEAKLAKEMDRMGEQRMTQATQWAGRAAIMKGL